MHHYARCCLNTVYVHAVNSQENGKNVVCLRSDAINSADAPNINRIMTTPPNVTANETYYIEQVNCNEGTHELVYVALTLLITR